MDWKSSVSIAMRRGREHWVIRIETLSSCLIRRDDHSLESEMRDITKIDNPDIQ